LNMLVVRNAFALACTPVLGVLEVLITHGWILVGTSLLALHGLLLEMGCFCRSAGCFHPIRTKECGTFELLLLYAGQGNGFEVFAALTDERHILCALVMLGLFGLTRWILTILVMGDIGHFLWSSSGRLVLNALRVLEMRTSLAGLWALYAWVA
jgi:hypothetical protein